MASCKRSHQQPTFVISGFDWIFLFQKSSLPKTGEGQKWRSMFLELNSDTKPSSDWTSRNSSNISFWSLVLVINPQIYLGQPILLLPGTEEIPRKCDFSLKSEQLWKNWDEQVTWNTHEKKVWTIKLFALIPRGKQIGRMFNMEARHFAKNDSFLGRIEVILLPFTHGTVTQRRSSLLPFVQK